MFNYFRPILKKGSAKSGNWGHAGRPGKRGGSAPKKKGGFGVGTYIATPMSIKNNEILFDHLDDAMEGTLDRSIRAGFQMSGELEEDVKATAIINATTDTDADPAKMERMMDTWADTSGNHNVGALMTQKAAEKEFGVSGSTYIDKNIEDVNKARFGTATSDYSRLPDYTENQKVLRATYDHTQSQLRSMGIKPDDKVTLYRGTMFKRGEPIEVGTTMKYKDNPLSSWTLSQDIGEVFGGLYSDNPGSVGITVRSSVPARNILSIPTTGFGTFEELEVVVIGAEGMGRITAVH